MQTAPTFARCSTPQSTPNHSAAALLCERKRCSASEGLGFRCIPTRRRTRRRPVLKTAAALFRQAVDAALYGFLAVCWAHSLCGVAVQILARWVYGEGSAAEAIGATVRAGCWFVMVRLFSFVFPLILMRTIEHADFDKEKERREELASNEQLPQRNGARHMLPDGINLAPLYLIPPLCKLMCSATMMKHTHEEGSSMWRVGSILLDMAHFSLAVTSGFVYQNLVILVTVPRVAKDEYA